jgi:DNA gyrase subunit A
VSAAVPLEVSDDPCFVLMSSAGLLARTTDQEPLGDGGGRSKHDVVLSAVPATARGQVGVVTSGGRLIRLDVLDLPTLPSTANAPHLQGGAPISEFLVLEPGERALSLSTLDPDSLGLALGTAAGVVKRVTPEHLANKDAWDVIRLDEGDEVVGAVELRSGDEELVFVSSSAQLLHFPASAVRPQGRSGGGVAGLRVSDGARVTFFGAVDRERDNVVVTVGGSSQSLPGTEAGSLKVTPFAEYPGKGRATGGVRCHRFLKGEDALIIAWAGPAPARAAATSGAPIDLPPADGRRDGSGTPAPQPVAAVAGPAASQTPSA